ncbi:protein of unknown function [Pseudomonas mediterranea]
MHLLIPALLEPRVRGYRCCDSVPKEQRVDLLANGMHRSCTWRSHHIRQRTKDIAGVLLLCRFMYWKRRVLRLGFRVHMVPSVILAIIAFGFWAGLDISKHVLSFSSEVLIFNRDCYSYRIEHVEGNFHPRLTYVVATCHKSSAGWHKASPFGPSPPSSSVFCYPCTTNEDASHG